MNPAACCWSGVFSSSTNSSTYSSYTTVSLDGRRRTKPHLSLSLSLLEYQMRCIDRKLAVGGWWVCFMLSVHFQAPHGCNMNAANRRRQYASENHGKKLVANLDKSTTPTNNPKTCKDPFTKTKKEKTNKPQTSTSNWVREHEPKRLAKKLHKDQIVRDFFKKQTQKKQQQQINQQTNC